MRAPSPRRDWAVWAALRCLLILIIVGVLPWPEQVNDLNIYRAWAEGPLAEGRFPDDPMWQYPPLAGPLFRVGAALPGERMGFVLMLLAVDALVMWLLHRDAHGVERLLPEERLPDDVAEAAGTPVHDGSRPGPAAGRTNPSGRAAADDLERNRIAGPTLWALAPVVTGPLLLARFDVIPTAFAVAAALHLARPSRSGTIAAMGAWVKVWPVLVLAGLARRDLPRGLIGFVVASGLVAAALLATTSDVLSFLGQQRDRGLQIESVWAAPFLIARALGAPVAVVYRYGAHEIDAPWADAVASVAALATVLLLAAVVVSRLVGRLEAVRGADVALATVLFSVATSRVFSGQYFIWLLGLAAVCLNDRGSRMRPTVRLLVAAGLATHLIYPWLYSALLEGDPVAWLVQLVRVSLTLLAALAAGRVLWGARTRRLAAGGG